jgi:hypothetical protein
MFLHISEGSARNALVLLAKRGALITCGKDAYGNIGYEVSPGLTDYAQVSARRGRPGRVAVSLADLGADRAVIPGQPCRTNLSLVWSILKVHGPLPVDAITDVLFSWQTREAVYLLFRRGLLVETHDPVLGAPVYSVPPGAPDSYAVARRCCHGRPICTPGLDVSPVPLSPPPDNIDLPQCVCNESVSTRARVLAAVLHLSPIPAPASLLRRVFPQESMKSIAAHLSMLAQLGIVSRRKFLRRPVVYFVDDESRPAALAALSKMAARKRHLNPPCKET